VARDARLLEDRGAYALAAEALQGLRATTAPDADLDLALALDLARAGSPDSASVLLGSPLLDQALADSCPPARRRPYGWDRDGQWLDGRFDGWRWYIPRARAELQARLGRWSEARAAARLAVTERPLSGREWLLLAVCDGRAGDLAGAARAAELAAGLDPLLPEAQYLEGLFDWRAGRRADALERFADAVSLDSLFEPAVRARQRLRFFPGSAPDSLPAEFLTGARRAGLLTSPVGPKLESFVQTDRPATILAHANVPIPDSLTAAVRLPRLLLPVLVDGSGRAVLVDLPWLTPDDIPAPVVALLVGSLPAWRFSPALLGSSPVASWTGISLTVGTH
jgi:hypothetical protein